MSGLRAVVEDLARALDELSERRDALGRMQEFVAAMEGLGRPVAVRVCDAAVEFSVPFPRFGLNSDADAGGDSGEVEVIERAAFGAMMPGGIVDALLASPLPDPVAPLPDPVAPLPDPVAPLPDPVAPAPDPAPEALAPARPAPGQIWTEAEDARAVEVYVAARKGGAGHGKAVLAVARALGRPAAGTEFRFKKILRDRVEAALAVVVVPEAAVEVAPVSAPAPSVGSAPPLDGLSGVARAVRVAVNAVGHSGPWTDALDLEMINMAGLGFGIDDMAAELGIAARDVRERFRALTDAVRAVDYNAGAVAAQTRLVAELRARVAWAAAQVAA